MLSYCTFRDMIVVSVPAPARRGNAIGTMLPDFSPVFSSLKNRIPRIISSPIKNITSEPAKAKEEMSIPNRLKTADPKKRNAIIMLPETKVVVWALILNPSRFIFMITGIFPIISITENKIKVTESIAAIFISLIFLVVKKMFPSLATIAC